MATKNVTIYILAEPNGQITATVSAVCPEKWKQAIQFGAAVSQWSVDVPIPSNAVPVVTATLVSTTELPPVISSPI